MYATHITCPGINYASWESIATALRSQRLPSPLREFIIEKVANGLVSDLPGPNCFRTINEGANTTTFCNATWVTQEAAQQFVDLYAKFDPSASGTVVEV